MICLCAAARADEPTTQQRVAPSAKLSVVKIVGAYVATFDVNGQRGTIAIGGSGTGWFLTPDDKATRKLQLQLLKTLDKESGGKLARMSSRELEQLTARIKMVDKKKLAYIVLPNGDNLDYEIKQYGKPTPATTARSSR